jgi:hypothetical protein
MGDDRRPNLTKDGEGSKSKNKNELIVIYWMLDVPLNGND